MMNITKNLKMMFRSFLLKAAQVETEKGILYADGEEFVVGAEVFVKEVAEDGSENFIVAADGEYTAGDTVYVVVEGKIAEIRKPEPEAPVEEIIEVIAAEGAEPVEGEGEGEKGEDGAESEKDDWARVDALEARVAEFAELFEQMIAKMQDMQERLSKMEAEPAASPAEELVEVQAGENTPASMIKKILNR